MRRILSAVVLVAVMVAVPVSPAPSVGAACSLCAGGEYHPLTPARIYDSRPPGINAGVPGAKPIGPNTPKFDLQLLGRGGVPASAADVLAVAINITIDAPTRSGWLAVYPTGSPSSSSVLNFTAGQTVPNMAIVTAGSGGMLTVEIWGDAAGTANVLVDVSGWFSTSGYTAGTPNDFADERGARLVVVSPGRIVDTRGGAAAAPLGPDGRLRVPFRGATVLGGGIIVPSDSSVVGALVNVTAVAPTASTWVSVLPTEPVGEPTTSNLNVSAGRVQAGLVMVPVGADGAIHLYNRLGNTNLIVDVMGYLQTGAVEATRAGRVIPLGAPFRAFDTRQAAFGNVPLGPGQGEDWSFAAFASSVNIGGTAVGNQAALLGNLTNASLSRQYPTVGVQSYLTLYPSDVATLPVVSNLNSYESAPVPNMVVAKYSSDGQYRVRVFNATGYAHYLLDVSAVVLAD